jgi:putative flippase GtrA
MHDATRSPLAHQFLRFAGVGAIGTGVHYVVYVLLVRSHLADAVLASATGFTAGALLNYTMSATVVFRNARTHRQAMWRFFTVAGIGLGLNSAMVAAATHSFGLHYFLAQMTATGVVLLWTFSGNRWWTFAEEA